MDSNEVKKLKKTLYWMYLRFSDSEFFFIGSVIARVTYKEFYSLAEKYNLQGADLFIFFHLKHKYFKIWHDTEKTFDDTDVANALSYLKKYTAEIKYYPFIQRAKSLQKYFAPLPNKVTPLEGYYLRLMLNQESLNVRVCIDEKSARQYFEGFDFAQQIDLYQVYVLEKDGEKYFDLCDLCELEKILREEYMPQKCTKSEFILAKTLFRELMI